MKFKPKRATSHVFWWWFPLTAIFLWPAFWIGSIPPIYRWLHWHAGLRFYRSHMDTWYGMTKMANFMRKDASGDYQSGLNPHDEVFRPAREAVYSLVYWRNIKKLGVQKASKKAFNAAESRLTETLGGPRKPCYGYAAEHHDDCVLLVQLLGRAGGTVALALSPDIYKQTKPGDRFMVGDGGAIGPFSI